MNKNNLQIKNINRLIYIILFIMIVLLIVFILTKNFNKETIGDINKVYDNSVQKEINDIENRNTSNMVADNELQNDIDDNILQSKIEDNELLKEDIDKTNNNKNREFGNNVAFIGDSRTQAFLMYAGLKDVNDYTNIGLMVDTAITKKFITDSNGEKITILEDMKNKNIDTIYIMLGINELGWIYSSIFIKEYENLIDKIREIKPNCEIIVQSIIPITKTKSDSDSIYNNEKIKEYNTLIKEMTNRKKVKFIDLVPELADKNGNLPEDASPDGIHLNKKYCLKWLECLKKQ